MVRRLMGAGILVFCVTLLTVHAQDKKPEAKKPAEFDVKDVAVRISGPYVHENLSVFLLHAKDQDDRDFLTLDQALEKKLVSVNEQDREQVGELVIENKSNQPLFLQEGDRIQGGNQDRIITTSLVVPPKSGKMRLPTFCCEAHRWAPGKSGKMFNSTSNTILAPLSVRAASKGVAGRGGQRAVWDAVAKDKKSAEDKLGAKNVTSSLNEALNSAEVKKVCDACGKVMKDLLAKHPDAIGVAIAVNGKIEEIDLYPNAKLMARIFPPLVQSSAVQACLEKDQLKGKPAPAVKTEDVEKFMAGKEKDRQFEGINEDNRIRYREMGKQVEFSTAFRDRVIHRQWINKDVVPDVPSPKK